ncbi:MAG: sulfatase, partial [Pirellula sp.]
MRLSFVTFCHTLSVSVLGFCLANFTTQQAIAQNSGKPNLLIFYSDDQGWGETGCYGNKEIPTPNIDALAANGVRFTQGYVAATYCSPSRAGLLTGKYPTRFGHEFNAVAKVTWSSLSPDLLATALN